MRWKWLLFGTLAENDLTLDWRREMRSTLKPEADTDANVMFYEFYLNYLFIYARIYSYSTEERKVPSSLDYEQL